jgi:hypothetical protein
LQLHTGELKGVCRPQAKFESSDFQSVISSVLGIFYMLAYLYPVSQMIRILVLDKEQKLKEGMRYSELSVHILNESPCCLC